MRLMAILACVAALAAPALRAQQGGWGDLDGLLAATLAPGEDVAAGFWLPDHAAPDRAGTAIGVVYPVIRGAAGNTGIVTGLFQAQGGRWVLVRLLDGLFGQSPRDAAFLPGRIELTTTMQGPGEPRCCPTLPVRWSIDRASGAVRRLN